MRDAGLYHAMLSTVSLYMHGHLGIEARRDILFHRGETMKIIHERLANIDNVDKGLLMSTIVTILSFEVHPTLHPNKLKLICANIEPLRQLLHSKSASPRPPPSHRNLRRYRTLQYKRRVTARHSMGEHCRFRIGLIQKHQDAS